MYKNIASVCVAVLLASFVLSSCIYPRKYQKNKPFIYKNNITLIENQFSAEERKSLKAKLLTQLDDSAKVITKDYIFVFSTLNRPPVYDSSYAQKSTKNMKGFLTHLGYYNAQVHFKAGTIFKNDHQKISITYFVKPQNPTLIDTFAYRLKNKDMQNLALQSLPNSYVKKFTPVTKAEILAEIGRITDTFKNNGYYKITPDDLKMRGDTAIEALTNISDDPFENIRLIAEASRKKDSPTIKLGMVINPATDTLRLKKFYINNVFIYPDYSGTDNEQVNFKTDTLQGIYIKYQQYLFKNSFLTRNLFVTKGQLYRQQDIAKTANSFSKLGAWQNVNVITKDSANQLNVFLYLQPAKKIGFETNVETSYSINSNTNNVSVANAGNLLGLSLNTSLQNRNLGKQGVKWTNAFRAGVEFNLNAQRNTGRSINSNEISYTSTISIPKLVYPFQFINQRTLDGAHSFISVSAANTNRIDLFKLFSLGFSIGYELNLKKNRIVTIKPVNVEFSNLYNRSDAFDATLVANPYLRYSFNTALVIGSSIGFTQTVSHQNKQHTIKLNFEESGAPFFLLSLGAIKSIEKDLRQFIKLDAEYTASINHKKSQQTFRAFLGIGAPVGKSDSALPFFKQYFAGGPNSMRGWPVRGIGPGAKPLGTYNQRLLNDRTGDIRFELNAEYRHDLLQIKPNSIVLKWAMFTDIGNIWNWRNTVPGGGYDSLQFNFKNLYKQLGVTIGTGFRLDFNYFLIRFDLGFRFKRPDIATNSGWQIPDINFNNLFRKGEKVPSLTDPNVMINDERYRIWRYQNFNFTIGLNYPF